MKAIKTMDKTWGDRFLFNIMKLGFNEITLPTSTWPLEKRYMISKSGHLILTEYLMYTLGNNTLLNLMKPDAIELFKQDCQYMVSCALFNTITIFLSEKEFVNILNEWKVSTPKIDIYIKILDKMKDKFSESFQVCQSRFNNESYNQESNLFRKFMQETKESLRNKLNNFSSINLLKTELKNLNMFKKYQLKTVDEYFVDDAKRIYLNLSYEEMLELNSLNKEKDYDKLLTTLKSMYENIELKSKYDEIVKNSEKSNNLSKIYYLIRYLICFESNEDDEIRKRNNIIYGTIMTDIIQKISGSLRNVTDVIANIIIPPILLLKSHDHTLNFTKYVRLIENCESPDEIHNTMIRFKGEIAECLLCLDNGQEYIPESQKLSFPEILTNFLSENGYEIPSLNLYQCYADSVDITEETEGIDVVIYEYSWVSNNIEKIKRDKMKWDETFSKLKNVSFKSPFGNSKISLDLIIDSRNNKSILNVDYLIANPTNPIKKIIESIIQVFKILHSNTGFSDYNSLAFLVKSPEFGGLDIPKMRFFKPSEQVMKELKTKVKERLDEVDMTSKLESMDESQPDVDSLVSYVTENINDFKDLRWVNVTRRYRKDLSESFYSDIFSIPNYKSLLRTGNHEMELHTFSFNTNYDDKLLIDRFSFLSEFLEHTDKLSTRKIKVHLTVWLQSLYGFKYWVSSNFMYGKSFKFKEIKKK